MTSGFSVLMIGGVRSTLIMTIGTTIGTAIAAFVATNIDDLAVLLVLFAQCRRGRQRRDVVLGQYFGFTGLLLLSLPGFLGGQVIPRPWLGWLGLLPIAIGFKAQFAAALDQPVTDPSHRGRSLGILAIAGVTIANGGDNLGIYLPLFANQTGLSLGIMVLTFWVMVGCWCGLARWIAERPQLEPWLQAHSQRWVPIVLMGLGLYIWIENQAWRVLGFLK